MCLTLALMSTLAPFCSRYLTTSAWPALAAMCNAVSPLYNKTFDAVFVNCNDEFKIHFKLIIT